MFYCFPFIFNSRYHVFAHFSSWIFIETYSVGWRLSFDQVFLWWLLCIFFIGLVFNMVLVMSVGLKWEIQHEWYKLILICICRKMFELFEERPACLWEVLKAKADRKTSTLSKYSIFNVEMHVLSTFLSSITSTLHSGTKNYSHLKRSSWSIWMNCLHRNYVLFWYFLKLCTGYKFS